MIEVLKDTAQRIGLAAEEAAARSQPGSAE